MALVVGTNCGFVTTAPATDPSGETTFVIDNRSATIKVVTTNAIIVTEVGWWCDNAVEERNFEVGIYTHDAANDEPESLLHVDRTNTKGTTAGWKTVTGLNWNLAASTTYWLAVQLDNTTPATNLDKSAIGGERYCEDFPSSTLLDPFELSSGIDNVMVSIYAVVEEEAVGTNISINIADTFKDVDSLQINISDVWKDVAEVQQNIGDVWKTVF